MDTVLELIKMLCITKDINPTRLLDSEGLVKAVEVSRRSVAKVVKSYESQVAKMAWMGIGGGAEGRDEEFNGGGGWGFGITNEIIPNVLLDKSGWVKVVVMMVVNGDK
ncbi:hypothetical protein BDZ91DRAFT_801918 [Kalaharituber pfeilii]|nr:hypothetical protein BDZ91DRAFT_801918 [Kalaharituber pfeilii]